MTVGVAVRALDVRWMCSSTGGTPVSHWPGMGRSLQDMVVVITGASAGIGKALAEALHARGARLALAARRLDRIESLNRELGGKHLALQIDVSDPAQCEPLVRRSVEHFGRIDTLVCNAGYGVLRPVA